jgi:ferredoxin
MSASLRVMSLFGIYGGNRMSKINIKIDENACVGCELCTDICPTEVFEMIEVIKKNQIKNVARVKEKAREKEEVKDCIGCLSCTYICPATAIECKNVHLVKNFYRDLETIEKLKGFIGYEVREEELTLDDYQKAHQEVSFLLDVLTETISDLAGRAITIVGRESGKVAAKQMPLYFEQKNLQEVLKTLQNSLKAGWSFQFELPEDDILILSFDHCILREIAQKQQKLGSNLCVFFHSYLGGIIGEFLKKTSVIKSVEPDQKECKVEIELR